MQFPPARVLKRSALVSVIVGSALNLINQPEAIFGPAQIVWWKLALTYAVPFLVATYGAMAAMKDEERPPSA
ncbi:MAG: nitrate/nitrite transporter NrtS [Pseudomonadota bacterium]